MKLNFQWKQQTGQYESGENLYLNNIKVGLVSHNLTRDYVWRASILLPRIDKNIYGNNISELKRDIELLITAWFEEALKGSEVK
jgi:hypothetical protein